MTTATLFQKREALRSFYSQGIKPVDNRQPIPEKLAQEMVQELVDLDIPKDALIGVVDTFLTLSLTLLEHGFTNLVLLENTHKNLTESRKRYYNNIKGICEKVGIKYYVPPINNYGRCNMKFDVVIGNPPYQSDKGGGSFRGSGTNPLWLQITKNSINLLKKNGILSFVTPTNIVNGGDHFTKLVLGAEREYDLVSVDFSADDYFKVGIPICRWILKNSLTNEHNVVVNDGRVLDATTTLKISKDTIFDEILSAVFNYDGKKLKFDTSNRYDFQNIERYLRKQNLPVEWAKDLKLTQDEVYQYPVNINGKIKYSRIKWKNNGIWRLFIAKMQNPLTFEISKEWEADGSTFTMVFDSEEDALRTQGYLNDPIYKWIIEQTRVSGRVNGTTISKFPNAPIQEVLTSNQLSYIQSQL
jgi:hypothetical protein